MKHVMKALLLSIPLTLSLPACAGDRDAEMRTVTTSGSAEIRRSPDLADLRLAVVARRPEAAAAKQEADGRVDALLERLRALEVAEADIEAGQLMLNPRYDYRDGDRRFLGFEARRPVTVTVRRLDALGRLMESALEAGVEQVGGADFRLDDSEAAEHEALEQAIADSRDRARRLAAGYGATLGAVREIQYEPQGDQGPGPVMMRMAQEESGGTYLPGEIVISARVSVSFDLQVER